MSKKFVKILVAIFLLNFYLISSGKGENISPQIVITPSRFEEKIVISPYDTIVITGKELKEKGMKTLDEALRNVCGLFLTQNGAGGITSIFTRGLDSKYTVVMIDGIKVYDPSEISEGDASWIVPAISVKNIDRIEIVKGVNTSLYGSNAVGGIINIITKKPKKTEVSVWSEIGSYDTFNKGGAISLKKGNFFGKLSVSHLQMNDFSKKAAYPDHDYYHNLNILEKLGFQNEKFEAAVSTYILKVKQDLDGWDYNERTSLENFQGNFKYALSPDVRFHLKVNYTPTKREYNDAKDVYRGRLFAVEFQNVFFLNKRLKTLIGFDYSKETADIDTRWENLKKSVYSYAPFLSLIFDLNKFYLKSGVRYNYHETSGDSLTADLSSYWFPFKYLKLYINIGKGFVSPSLYQLYSSYGNKDLKPEKSLSLATGLSLYTFKNRVIWNLSYFTSKIKDKIEYDFSTSKYYNIGEVNTRGYEASVAGKLNKFVKTMFYYDWLWAKDKNGKVLSRRPHIKAGGEVTFLYKNASFTFESKYVGNYKDGSHSLGRYFVANLYFSYQVKEHLRVYGKVLNLFDRDYQEIYGYNTYKRSIWVGAEIKW